MIIALFYNIDTNYRAYYLLIFFFLLVETKHFQNSFQDTKLPFVKQSIEEIVQHVNEKPDQSGSNFSPLLYSIDQVGTRRSVS